MSVEALEKMDDTTRWLFLRYIDNIRAREMWEQRKCLASVRAEGDSRRDYLAELADLAFWNDEEVRAAIIEAAARTE